jgi:predicted O-methyltransferase YrrM
MLWSVRFFASECKSRNLSLLANLKYFSRWRKGIQPDASSVKDQQPWITFKVIDFLNQNLNKEHRVFEYGGGGSTLFFVTRCKEVVTVENNKEWFSILSGLIKKSSAENWKGNFIEGEKGDLNSSPESANPLHYSSSDPGSAGTNFLKYASAIDEYANSYFDLVLVDGRSRASCIQHGIPKIKKGGLLIVDNSDRSYYFKYLDKVLQEQFSVVIDEYGPSPYSKDFTKTSVWKKIV